MTDAIRSVLFVDFDNVFFSLQSADKAAAKSFANDPRRWLDAIESGSLIEAVAGSPAIGRRRILMRRCYANPAVMRYFRSYFTRSGFQIVDCPPLTGRGKNSADIYMVVDMLDALRHETHFDEFIILSGDADFTPVLLRLRAYDRSSVIYSNAVTATAYKSLCDGMITEERLIDLTADAMDGEEEAVGPVQGPPTAAVGAQPYSEALPMPERRLERASPERAGPERLPPERPLADRPPAERPAERPRAFERRRAPARPADAVELTNGDGGPKPVRVAPEFAGLARRVNAATNVPMFSSEVYAALFRVLAGEVRDNGFSFNRTVNAVIRRLGEAGLKLRPQLVAFVVKGLMLSGHEFVAEDTPASLAKGFRRQVLYLCANEDLALTETERGQIGLWIVGGLRNLPESEILASEPVTTDASRAAEVAGVDPDADEGEHLDMDRDEDDGGEAEEADDDREEDRSPEESAAADYADEAQDLDLREQSSAAADTPEAEKDEPAKPRIKLDDLLARMRSPSRS